MVLRVESDEDVRILGVVKACLREEEVHYLLVDDGHADVLVIGLVHGSVLFGHVALVQGSGDDGGAALDLGTLGRVSDEVVGNCEGEGRAGGAANGEELGRVATDRGGVGVGPLVDLERVEELGRGFVLRGQAVVDTDYYAGRMFGDRAAYCLEANPGQLRRPLPPPPKISY